MTRSPTQRSLTWLRDQGYTAQVVERFNHYAKVRQDLFGIIDVLAIKPGEVGTLGVQATTGTHRSHRRTKALREPRLSTWLACGNRFELHTWAKRGQRGKCKTWQLTRHPLPNSMLNP